MAEKKKIFPCNPDHNGECLQCDCWLDNCAYDRWVKGDYKWETEAELDKMFEGYEKIKTYPDDGN
jgi:hypothetical protein